MRLPSIFLGIVAVASIPCSGRECRPVVRSSSTISESSTSSSTSSDSTISTATITATATTTTADTGTTSHGGTSTSDSTNTTSTTTIIATTGDSSTTSDSSTATSDASASASTNSATTIITTTASDSSTTTTSEITTTSDSTDISDTTTIGDGTTTTTTTTSDSDSDSTSTTSSIAAPTASPFTLIGRTASGNTPADGASLLNGGDFNYLKFNPSPALAYQNTPFYIDSLTNYLRVNGINWVVLYEGSLYAASAITIQSTQVTQVVCTSAVVGQPLSCYLEGQPAASVFNIYPGFARDIALEMTTQAGVSSPFVAISLIVQSA